MDTRRNRNAPFDAALAVIAAFSAGIGLAIVPGCNSSMDEPAKDEVTAAAAAPGAPASRQTSGPSPSERLKQYQPHAPPQLAAADHVAKFLDWAGASHVDEKEDARGVIAAAAGNKAVILGLMTEIERVQSLDHTRALLAMAILGETRSALAQDYLATFVRRPLPQTGTMIEGEIIEQTQAAQLQGKAVDGLAYLNSDSSNKLVMEIIATHPSRIVRAEAINAYLWNHGDSAEARTALARVVRKDEAILLDRVRRAPGDTAATFNAKLERFLALHPEAVPPVPDRSQTASQAAPQRPALDVRPPAF